MKSISDVSIQMADPKSIRLFEKMGKATVLGPHQPVEAPKQLATSTSSTGSPAQAESPLATSL